MLKILFIFIILYKDDRKRWKIIFFCMSYIEIDILLFKNKNALKLYNLCMYYMLKLNKKCTLQNVIHVVQHFREVFSIFMYKQYKPFYQ